MPSNQAFLNPNIVQPTKYVVPPTCVAEELPPEPWQLPKFEPFIIDDYNAYSEPILPLIPIQTIQWRCSICFTQI